MANIESITDTAAELYRGGKEISIAVGEALDARGITNRYERTRLFPQVCSQLGKRGAVRKAAIKRESATDFSAISIERRW